MNKAVKIRNSVFWWMGVWLTMNAATLTVLEIGNFLRRRRALKMIHQCVMFSVRKMDSQDEEKAAQ